jgi:hypothetical protein
MELLPTDRLASPSRLDTSPLQFALNDIESYLKREHGERSPTDDRSSRQDQKRRHLNLQRRIRGKSQTNMKWSRDEGIAVRVLLLRYFAASRLSEACKSSTASANYAKMRGAPRTPRRNCAAAVNQGAATPLDHEGRSLSPPSRDMSWPGGGSIQDQSRSLAMQSLWGPSRVTH